MTVLLQLLLAHFLGLKWVKSGEIRDPSESTLKICWFVDEWKSHWRHQRMTHRWRIDLHRCEWVMLYQPNFYMEPHFFMRFDGCGRLFSKLGCCTILQYINMGFCVEFRVNPLGSGFFPSHDWLSQWTPGPQLGLRDPRIYYLILPIDMFEIF